MPRRLSSIIVAFVLLTIVGCGDDGGSGAADPNPFALQGPHAALREDTEDFVVFFPEDLDVQERWPALIWFNGSSGYTETNNYNPLLESIASWGLVVLGGKSEGMNPAESDQRQELIRRHQDATDVLGGLLNHESAIHSTPRGDAGVYREPVIAFLRWQLASDPVGRGWFVGDACTVCQDPAWAYDERNGTPP